MPKKINWKIILVLVVLALSLIVTYINKINLGLDLKGGMHLVFHVITDDAINAETDLEILRLKDQLTKKNIEHEAFTKGRVGEFTIQNIRPDQDDLIKNILDENFKEWNYSIVGTTVAMSLRPNAAQYFRDQAVNQARETINNRVDEFGVAEPVIQRQGGDRIIVELPGVDNPERVMNIIKTTAFLEWRLVKAGPAPDMETLLTDFGGKVPEDMEVMKGDPTRMKGPEAGYYLVTNISEITGNDLRSTRRSVDEWNNPAVAFSFNPDAAKRFYKLTSENLNKPLAIILDKKIQQVATIEDKISDSGILRGRFTIEEAEDISLVLRAGALPATIKTIENRTVGPSLGADSVREGFSAGVIALILVMAFMLFYYRLSGLNAVVALFLNIIILMGALAYFKATLTVPGIAGIILTMGMAVDANVLIFERIREELGLGKRVSTAIANGFSRAFRTIIDSNVTTIIAAIFLFQFGTGPIRGFAVTLIIGITASMFTAVFVSRIIFDLATSKRKKREKLSI